MLSTAREQWHCAPAVPYRVNFMCSSCISRRGLLASGLAASFATSAWAAETVEPRFRRSPSPIGKPRVALTLDACSGGFDQRMADVLIQYEIKTTIFLTGRWIKRNPVALDQLLFHSPLFTFENHGARHVPPILGEDTMYGLAVAGTLDAVRREVEDGAQAIQAATGAKTTWYRGATARYSLEAITEIKRLGYKIAAYSLNADRGASLPAALAAAQMEKTQNGDVIIGHINQPGRSAGEGIVQGILTLRDKGFTFVDLDALDLHEQTNRKKSRDRYNGPEIPI